jgi:citrate lyase beta subunit
MFARQSIVIHCKAYGLQAIDMVHIDYKGVNISTKLCLVFYQFYMDVITTAINDICIVLDLDRLKEESIEGARMGFTGTFVNI